MTMSRFQAVCATVMVSAVIAATADGAGAPPNGARPMGMGQAFVAVADDANATLFNPAGISGRTYSEAAFTRTAFFSGPTDPLVSQDSAFAVVPIAGGAVAGGFKLLQDAAGIYRDETIMAGFGLPLGGRVRVGLLGKLLRAGLADVPDVVANDYFAGARSTSAATVDIGLLLSPTDSWSIGAAAQNLIPADLAFQDSEEFGGDETPQILRVGTAYRLSGIASAAEEPALREVLERSLIAADVAVGDGTVIGGGLELGLSDALTTRVGYRSATGRQQGVTAITLGASVGFALGGMRVHVDYALDLATTELKDNVTQHVSLRVAWLNGEKP